MQYPHDRYIRWLITQGLETGQIIRDCTDRHLYVDVINFAHQEEAIRQDMMALGGKSAQRHLDPAQEKKGKALTVNTLKKIIGTPYSLQDADLKGQLETLLRVRPARRMIQILAAKKQPPEIIAHQLQTRFDMDIPPELVHAFCEFFWDVSNAGYAGLYNYVQIIPEKDKDREFFTVYLGKDLQSIYWKLGVQNLLQWDQTETMRLFLAGANQQLLNAVDSEMNPEGIAPTAWMNVVKDGLDVYYDSLERSKEQSARDLFKKFNDEIQLKMEKQPDLPVIGESDNIV